MKSVKMSTRLTLAATGLLLCVGTTANGNTLDNESELLMYGNQTGVMQSEQIHAGVAAQATDVTVKIEILAKSGEELFELLSVTTSDTLQPAMNAISVHHNAEKMVLQVAEAETPHLMNGGDYNADLDATVLTMDVLQPAVGTIGVDHGADATVLELAKAEAVQPAIGVDHGADATAITITALDLLQPAIGAIGVDTDADATAIALTASDLPLPVIDNGLTVLPLNGQAAFPPSANVVLS